MGASRHPLTHEIADMSSSEEAFAGESEIWSYPSNPRRADSAVW